MASAWEWLDVLYPSLMKRQPEIRRFDNYYTGEHPLPFVTRAHKSKMFDEFRKMLEDSRTNIMRLVVDAVEERLEVSGFRLSASSSAAADSRSWEIWQANEMDAHSQTAFVEALVKGVSYLSVWSPEKEGGAPVIAVEDPAQTIVGYEPGTNYRKRAAALKVWTDEWTGRQRANVYLPDGIHKFERTGSTTVTGATGNEKTFGPLTQGGSVQTSVAAGSWKNLTDEFVKNPVGEVPIVPLRNRPRLLVEGESELADVWRIQNQINGFLFLLALAGYFGAHRQRWAVGISLMTKEGEESSLPFDVAVDRLWTSTSPETKFGEFTETSLEGYLKSIDQKIQHIALTTRTPRHYLMAEGQDPSGDSIKSAESGLTKKVERKQRTYGDGLEETIRLARLFDGSADSPPDSEVVWADPSIRTEAEITDAAIKKFQVGAITWQQMCEDMGYSATTIERMLEQFGGKVPTPPSTAPEAPAPV